MGKVDIWAIVGTRRWARVVAGELCVILPDDAIINMLGDPNDVALQEWLSVSNLKERVHIVRSLRPCFAFEIGVALVINSAYQHASSIEALLYAGYHVVSEKPLSFSKKQTQGLIDLAKKLNLSLFSTNTYLFADYIYSFKENWLKSCRFTKVEIFWSDAICEFRYGEGKKYDSSVPIIFDVLPHVACLIAATLGLQYIHSSDIEVYSGGSAVLVRYYAEDFVVIVHMARNSEARRRCMHFTGPCVDVKIDFSVEPGFIVNNGCNVLSDVAWQQMSRPIASMINSLINFFENKQLDSRLSSSVALYANELIDSVVYDYVEHQVAFLSTYKEKSNQVIDSSFEYAVIESNSISKRLSPSILENSPLHRMAEIANLI
jgi:hypothetical protein